MNKNKSDKIFINNFDFLIFKMFNILTANDKPFIFLIPILILNIANIFYKLFEPIYFSIILFLGYQYICGNSVICFFKNALAYFFIILFVYKFFF